MAPEGSQEKEEMTKLIDLGLLTEQLKLRALAASIAEGYVPGQKQRRDYQRKQVRAYRELNSAIRNGRVQRQPCERCGVSRVEAHHEDYSKPLHVRWLCIRHHKERHGRLKA